MLGNLSGFPSFLLRPSDASNIRHIATFDPSMPDTEREQQSSKDSVGCSDCSLQLQREESESEAFAVGIEGERAGDAA